MNASATGPQNLPTPLGPSAQSASTARRDDPRVPTQDASPEQRDAFALALHGKSKRQDQDEKQDPQPDASALAALAAGAPPPLRHVAPAAPPPAPVETDPATGTRAHIEAALSNPGLLVTPLGATDPAALWEASISEPNGIPVDVRALRADGATTQAGQPAWTVAVSSSKVNADVLARHAPRLDERLRKRSAGVVHVRIESETEDTE